MNISMPMYDNGELVIVMSAMNRTGFDFVGKFAGVADNCILLENALVIDYGEGYKLQRLAPLHLPAGAVDILEGESVLAYPLDGVGYAVSAKKGWIRDRYEEFFRLGKLVNEDLKNPEN